MKQATDVFTQEIEGLPKRRGRPASGKAKSGAERAAARRERLKAEGKEVLSCEVGADVIEALRKNVQFKDLTQGEAVDRILRAYLLRKR
jgi:hypothetical protein